MFHQIVFLLLIVSSLYCKFNSSAVCVQSFSEHCLQRRGGSRIFLGGGALVSSNKPHSFFAEYQLYQKTAGHLRGGGAHPLHPPPRSAPAGVLKMPRVTETLLKIDLVTVFEAILTSRQTREKLQCLYENLMSNNFHRTAVLKKI